MDSQNKNYFLTILCIAVLSACAGSTKSPLLTETYVPASSPEPLPTSTPTRLISTPTKIPETSISTLTTTPGPIIDAQGKITWQTQDVLIAWETGGGDGVSFNYPPEFVLLKDGTLLQEGREYFGAPFISKLDRHEMCKLFNTVELSGFFEEPRYYMFPFDGLGSTYITVNGWKSNSSGGQILEYAISGAPYYDGLFCRNCPIPSEETIIQPGLANIYFLLRNYVGEKRTVAPIEKIIVYLIPVDQELHAQDWPITSISLSELVRKCNESYCDEAGMVLDGHVAKEFVEKIRGDEFFQDSSFFNSIPFRVRYRAVWPYEPSIMYYSGLQNLRPSENATDSQMTCSSEDGQYPLLPLNKENKFWYYAPDGNWGAELMEDSGQIPKVRIVNKSGYEKIYQYDPLLFDQVSIRVFPRFWTPDARYFFVNVLRGDFQPQTSPFSDSIALQRVTVADGKVSYLFAGIEGQEYAYTLSENGGLVAYIRQGDLPIKIVIKDTHSQKEKAAALIAPERGEGNYSNAGTLVWSPDETTVFVAAIYRENGVDTGRLISINVSNPAIQKIIYESASPFKLKQFSYHDWNAELCSLEADRETYCPIRLDLETQTVK